MMIDSARRPLVVAVLVAIGAPAHAQDNHFNTHQFGSRSSLYGGAVVGGVRDTSATYYNPGGLAFVENENLAVNASVYRAGRLSLEDGAGTGSALRSSPVEQFPAILSGVLLFDDLPGHALGYSLLTRQRFTVSTTGRVDDVRNVINDAIDPGSEDFIGQVSIRSDLNELWGGVTWATRLGAEWGVGLTTFLALRTQDLGYTVSARAVGNPSGAIHSTNASVDTDFLNLRSLWRLGVSYGTGDTRLGVAMTTPSLSLYGKGTVFGDFTVQQIDLNGDGTADSFTANDRQHGLDASFRSPLALSFGIEQRVQRWTFALSADVHFEQDPFKVMQPEPGPFLRPSGSFSVDEVTETLRVTYETKTVTNAAAGIEYVFSSWLRGVFSIRTDYSAKVEKEPEDGSIRLGLAESDLLHVTIGVLLEDKNEDGVTKEEVSIGLTYSYGREDTKQVVNFATAAESNMLFGVPDSRDIAYDVVGLSIGYTRYF
ncbi:MAG: hypothetical protein HYY16_18705 [Planctomycetes bacterium]|nr:hypothetical protein [Planctomycetota bacterium]